jgi:hypothetical protein
LYVVKEFAWERRPRSAAENHGGIDSSTEFVEEGHVRAPAEKPGGTSGRRLKSPAAGKEFRDFFAAQGRGADLQPRALLEVRLHEEGSDTGECEVAHGIASGGVRVLVVAQ